MRQRLRISKRPCDRSDQCIVPNWHCSGNLVRRVVETTKKVEPPSAKRYKPETISSLEATRVTENVVTIHLEHVGRDTDEEFGARTAIYVDILLGGKAIGKISGTIIDRQVIPEYGFYDVMDCSGELDYVGATLFESRFGRTKLQSLREQADDS